MAGAESGPKQLTRSQSLRKQITEATSSTVTASARLIGALSAALSIFLQTVLMAVIYVLFVFSVLVQSTVSRTPVDPSKWETELKSRSWGYSLILLLLLIGTGLCASITSSGSPLASAGLYAFTFIMLTIHISTLYYATLRPELCDVRPLEGPDAWFCGIQTKFRVYYWRNYLALASVLIESSQYMSISLDQLEASGSLPADLATFLGWLRVTRGALHSERATFYTVISLVILYSLLIGFVVATKRQPNDPIGAFLFEVFAGTLYLPIVSQLLWTLARSNCTSWSIASAMALLFYGSTAVYVGVYRGDQGAFKSDINYVPRFLVVERITKGVFVAVWTFFQSNLKLWITNSVMLGLLAVLVLMMTFTRCCSLVGIVRFRLLLLLCCCWSFVVVICSLTSLQNNPIVVQRILPAGMAAITGLAVLWMLYYSFRGGCKFAVVLRRLSTVSIKIGMATLRKSSVHSKVSALSTGESVANPSQSGPQPDDSEDDSLSDNNQGHHHHDASQSQVEGLSVSSLRVSDHRRLNLNMSHGYVHSGSGQASARVHPLVPSEPPALKEFELAETTTTVTAHPQPAGESSQQMGITPREPLLAQSLPPGPTGHGERTESHSVTVDANSDSELEKDTNAAEPAVCSLSEDSDQS